MAQRKRPGRIPQAQHGEKSVGSRRDRRCRLLRPKPGRRWAIEEQFHDVKEIWGAGEQQVRNVWSNIGCWNLCGWLSTLVQLANWDQPAEQLVIPDIGRRAAGRLVDLLVARGVERERRRAGTVLIHELVH